MPSENKQLIVVSLPGKNMFSVRGAASRTPCYNYYNTHTQIMNIKRAPQEWKCITIVDLCRVCGCKLRRGIEAKGRAVKPEPPSYADNFLVAFNINVLVDTTSKCFAPCALKLTCSCGKRALQVLCSALYTCTCKVSRVSILTPIMNVIKNGTRF